MTNDEPKRRPELRPGEVPPERWSIERPFDSAEYLDGPPPRYSHEAGRQGGQDESEPK